MRIALTGMSLTLALLCVCFEASPQVEKTTVTGKLILATAIGGESTGWMIQLESALNIDGKQVDSIEIDSPEFDKLEQLQHRRVRATGKLSHRRGVEGGDRPILEVSSIRAAKSKPEHAAQPAPAGTSALHESGRDWTPLLGRIWRVTGAPSKSPSDSIYIFLANGTLLETSCVEPYRIATWTKDEKSPLMFRVVEDGQLAFTAAITELTDDTLRFRQTLTRSNETRDLVLKAVAAEFVCPDLPR
jgi:hypothetical protein